MSESSTEDLRQPAPVPQIDKLAAALAVAQGSLTNPPKTKTANVGRYKYRYADLAEIIEHVRPVLSKHDLAFVQLTQHSAAGNMLMTKLMHKSGQSLEATYPLPSVSVAAQEMGSAITYARRYSLCAILGIAADEDDDGSKAQAMPSAQELRDKLVDLMGDSSIGNKMLMDYAESVGLGSGKTSEDLSDEAIATLVTSWAAVSSAIKSQSKSKPLPKNAKPVEESSEGDELAGINPALAEKMRESKITPQMLKQYYVSQKHLPDTVEPQKLPDSYIKALLSAQNWEKAKKHMKNGDK